MPEKSPFTEDQINAMSHTRAVIQAIDDIMRGKDEYEYDEGEAAILAKFPGMTSVDKEFHDMGWRTHTFDLTSVSSSVPASIDLQGYYGEPQTKPFHKTTGLAFFNGEDHAAYQNLGIDYAGTVETAYGDQRDHYMLYRINQPDNPAHGMGIMRCAQVSIRHELMPVDGGLFGDISGFVRTAARRLGNLAARQPDAKLAQSLNAAAENATSQRFISATTYDINGNCHMGTSEEAKRLAGIINLAALRDKGRGGNGNL